MILGRDPLSGNSHDQDYHMFSMFRFGDFEFMNFICQWQAGRRPHPTLNSCSVHLCHPKYLAEVYFTDVESGARNVRPSFWGDEDCAPQQNQESNTNYSSICQNHSESICFWEEIKRPPSKKWLRHLSLLANLVPISGKN